MRTLKLIPVSKNKNRAQMEPGVSVWSAINLENKFQY
jgi:hypothetical protein